MNRVAPLLLLALMASPAVLAQTQPQTQAQTQAQDPRLQAFGGGTTVHFAGGPGSPGMVSAMQEVLPGADVSSVHTLPPRNGAQVPTESSLIGRAMPIPINPAVTPGTVEGAQPQDVPSEDVVYPDSPADIAARKAALWEAGAASQQLRQKGLSLGQGDRYHGSIAASKTEDDRVVLSRWKAFLPQFGVDPAKIEDESRRLPRAAFDAWASRFVWFACSSQSTSPRPTGCNHLAE